MNRALRRQQKKQQKKQLKSVLQSGTVLEKLQHGASLQKQKKYKEALRYYDAALQDEPDNTDALYLKGGLLVQVKKYDLAKPALLKCISLKEDAGPAHHNLGYAYLEEGAFEKAEEHLDRAHELNPDKASTAFFLQMARKRNNNKSSPEYIKMLYEAGAGVFEENLVKNLKYQTPKKLMDRLKAYLSTPAQNALDLGCGTGLMGVELGPHANKLVGVDIAENMIREAEKKAVYTDLVAAPLEEYLEETTEVFDLMTSADVFIYVGDLEKTFKGMKQRMEKGGLLAFTTETLPEDHKDDIWLDEDSNRHKHKDSYIRQLAEENGFEELLLEQDFSRFENKKPVQTTYAIFRRA